MAKSSGHCDDLDSLDLDLSGEDLDRTHRTPLADKQELLQVDSIQAAENFTGLRAGDIEDSTFNRTFRAPASDHLCDELATMRSEIQQLRRSHDELRLQLAAEQDSRKEFERDLSWKLLDEVKRLRHELGAGTSRASNWPYRDQLSEDSTCAKGLSDSVTTVTVASGSHSSSSEPKTGLCEMRPSDMLAPCPRTVRANSGESQDGTDQNGLAGRPSTLSWLSPFGSEACDRSANHATSQAPRASASSGQALSIPAKSGIDCSASSSTSSQKLPPDDETLELIIKRAANQAVVRQRPIRSPHDATTEVPVARGRLIGSTGKRAASSCEPGGHLQHEAGSAMSKMIVSVPGSTRGGETIQVPTQDDQKVEVFALNSLSPDSKIEVEYTSS